MHQVRNHHELEPSTLMTEIQHLSQQSDTTKSSSPTWTECSFLRIQNQTWQLYTTTMGQTGPKAFSTVLCFYWQSQLLVVERKTYLTKIALSHVPYSVNQRTLLVHLRQCTICGSLTLEYYLPYMANDIFSAWDDYQQCAKRIAEILQWRYLTILIRPAYWGLLPSVFLRHIFK